MPDLGDSAGTSLARLASVNTRSVSWLLYVVGSLLVFGSWVDLVSTGVGWAGWLMALVGWAAGDGRNPAIKAASRAEQIEKLDQLRQRRVITEDEFHQEKQRLLNAPT